MLLLNPYRYGGGGGGIPSVLLLHCDGSNGSTTFTDVYGKTVTPNGNAQISTAQSQFGGASCLLDGAGDYLSIPSTTDFAFPGDFTIEFWMYCSNGNGDAASLLINRNGGGGALDGIYSYAASNGTNCSINFGFGDASSSSSIISTAQTVSLNAWHHIAFVRNGTGFDIYVDGTSGASGTSSISITSNRAMWIGWDALNAVGGTDYNGYLDEIRITKGTARYTGNFTPSASAFTE